MLSSINVATGVVTTAYVLLAVAAVAGTLITIWHSRRTLEQTKRVHQETVRLDVYTEFVSALATARSAGRSWHKAIADKLPSVNLDSEGFFPANAFDQVKQAAESDKVEEERNAFFAAIDGLWNATAKVKLVGPDEVARAADDNVTAFDHRQRNLTAADLNMFHSNPGYPLPGASERRRKFVEHARSQLQYLGEFG